MVTVQVCPKDDELNILMRLKAYLEYLQDREFEGKAYRTYRGVGRRKTIRRKKISFSYIYNQALNFFWNENETRIHEFEERNKYR